MTWVKLPNELARDHRLYDAGPEAFTVHIAAMCYCMDQLTDGFIPARAARVLWPVDDPQAAVDALVANGLWKVSENGYQIVGFTDPDGLNQRTAENVRAERRKKAEKNAAYYERTREARKAQQSSDKDSDPTETKTEAKKRATPKPGSSDSAQPSPAQHSPRSDNGGGVLDGSGSGDALTRTPSPAHIQRFEVTAPPVAFSPPKITVTVVDGKSAKCTKCSFKKPLQDNGMCDTCALVVSTNG